MCDVEHVGMSNTCRRPEKGKLKGNQVEKRVRDKKGEEKVREKSEMETCVTEHTHTQVLSCLFAQIRTDQTNQNEKTGTKTSFTPLQCKLPDQVRKRTSVVKRSY